MRGQFGSLVKMPSYPLARRGVDSRIGMFDPLENQLFTDPLTNRAVMPVIFARIVFHEE